jgi:hypothetical protein
MIKRFKAILGNKKYYQGIGNSCYQGSTREVVFLHGDKILCKKMVGCGGSIPLKVPELMEMKVGEELPRDLVRIALDIQGDLNMWVGSHYYKIQ